MRVIYQSILFVNKYRCSINIIEGMTPHPHKKIPAKTPTPTSHPYLIFSLNPPCKYGTPVAGWGYEEVNMTRIFEWAVAIFLSAMVIPFAMFGFIVRRNKGIKRKVEFLTDRIAEFFGVG